MLSVLEDLPQDWRQEAVFESRVSGSVEQGRAVGVALARAHWKRPDRSKAAPGGACTGSEPASIPAHREHTRRRTAAGWGGWGRARDRVSCAPAALVAQRAQNREHALHAARLAEIRAATGKIRS